MTSQKERNAAWWPFGLPVDPSRIPLLCLPFAGGGASAFRSWRRLQPAGIEVCPIQLPGREARIRETPHKRVGTLVEDLGPALAPIAGRRWALFGHSMGAIIGYDLTRRAAEWDLTPPEHLFVSAARPPSALRRGPGTLHTLPDDDFLASLRDMKGTPEEVLAHQELMELLLPILRADFELCEMYVRPEGAPLGVPITAVGGTDDPQISSEDLEGWRRETTGDFQALRIPAAHFYLEEHAATILSLVARLLIGGADGDDRRA
jgi:medium-chain acyl-[acyl-carrier-protein] hydrolase